VCSSDLDDHEVVCEGSVILVVAQRVSMESRIAAKVVALGMNSGVGLVEDAPGKCASFDSFSLRERQIS
jgi:hypothetical protein